MKHKLSRLIPRTLYLITVFLAACAEAVPTLTPTPALSGPTLEPSPTFELSTRGDQPAEPVFEGQNNPTAAALAPGAAMPPFEIGQPPSDNPGRVVEITAEDGTLLQGELYVNATVLSPGVLLLADEGAGWGDFPGKLYEEGYTVLVMPVRPSNALSDFHVMLQTLINGVADPARLGVIGAGGGANVALLGCASDKLCDAVALLSPLPDPALLDAMPQINPRPMLLTASQEDSEAFSTIQDLQAAATGEVLFQPFNRAGAGTGLLQNRPDLGDLIASWLKLVLV
ncbi:MAG: hypothetical protein HZC41_26825 [Chloroflexi bacterium]|nr:hypothetical protein [Chloroflexota bacterium]